jgi:type I restriction enzyme S subunit
MSRVLKDIASITMGQSPDSATVSDREHGLPFLQGCAEFGSFTPSSRFFCSAPLRVAESGATLISVRAPVGTTNRADQRYCIGRGLAAVKEISTLGDDRFIQYCLEQNSAYLQRLSQGSTFAAISSKDLYDFPIPNFNLRQQRRIAEILSTVDAAIEATEALIAKQQQIKAGLMHDLFTRGVWTEAAIARAQAAGSPAAVSAKVGQLRPPRETAPELYKESPLGWIPRDWEVKKLSEVVPKAVYGISESLHDSGDIPVLRMNNIYDGEFKLDDIKYYSGPLLDALRLKKGDVLYNRTNSLEHVGKAAIWSDELEAATFASYLVRLEPDEKNLKPDFLAYWINWPATQKRLRTFASPGVHQVNINPTNFRRTLIALPSGLEEQSLAVDFLESQRRLHEADFSVFAKLHKQKQGLMQDLLSGQ